MSQRVSCACGGAASSLLPIPSPVSASLALPELSGSSAAPTYSIVPCLSPSSSTSALLAMALPPTTLPPLPLGLDNGPGSPDDHSAFPLAAHAALPFSSSPIPHSPNVRAGSPPPLP
ncbi:unnamed protein product [Closterium sp. Naga37s-1]|nr:unnamed protein product [Closterium sp. Naga37s-1]